RSAPELPVRGRRHRPESRSTLLGPATAAPRTPPARTAGLPSNHRARRAGLPSHETMQHVPMTPRTAHIRRETRESRVEVVLNLDGSGRGDVTTGIGFLDHMLDSLARHARFDLTVRAEGDLHVDQHHTAEDVGISLGQAHDKALGERRGIRRFGDAAVPLDEALAHVAVDLGGRGWATIDLPFHGATIGGFSSEMIPHLLQSFAIDGRFAL